MAADLAFVHYMKRREGIIKALTEDLDANLKMCKSVMPGSTYTKRYVLIGLDDGTYEIRHPTFNEKSAPPCLPPYHGQVTKNVWLKITLESVSSWLIGTLQSECDFNNMSSDDRKGLLQSIDSVSNIQQDVMSFHDKRSETSQTNSLDNLVEVSLAASKVLSPCENKSCIYVSESEWVECLVCNTWYHCICVGIRTSDDQSRDRFICGLC